MSKKGANNFSGSAAELALAASALAEAAQALSEAAAALSSMSQDIKSPSTVYESLENTPQVSESPGRDEEENSVQDIDDDASSVGANTGNNVYPRDITPQVPRPESPASITGDYHVQAESLGEQETLDLGSLDEIICPGHFYVVLEEEFDALPMILAYATAAKRTVCYVPTSGSLIPWESIMSSVIPDRQVRSAVSMMGSNIMQLGEVIEEFVSSSEGSVLVLRPTFIGRVNETRAHSAGDSLIVWGIPGQKFWPSTIQAVQQSKHTLFILSHREFHNPNRQPFFTELGSGFVVHPRHRVFNSFKPGSIMTSFRESVQRTISRTQHSQNIQSIYEELLESPINDTAHLHFVTESSTDRIEVVNKFAARVFLRGRTQDGSQRFTFNSQGLQIPDKTHRRLGALFKTRPQPGQNPHPGVGTNVNPKPKTTPSNPPLNNTPVFAHRPGRWRITLQEEADVIPLICYLAKQHPTSVCVISHSQSATPYRDLFEKISSHQVFTSGQAPLSFESAVGQFLQREVEAGLCLLRGITSPMGNTSLNFQKATASALIYWGLPPQDSFLWPSRISQNQFKHVYLITAPAHLLTVMSLIGAAFQEHPDSDSLVMQGPASLLHAGREKARQTLINLPRGTIDDMAGIKFKLGLNMGADNSAQGAAGIALAANALAEAAQALSEAAAALSDMSRDFEPSSAVYSSLDNAAQVTKNQAKNDEEDPLQENDDDDASSVGANTGNNVYRRDTSPLDPYTPGPPHTYYAPITVNAQEQPRSFGEQKQFGVNSLDELLFPGHFYIVLEEEFDALPLILAYATAAKRTVCYVPTSGSLIPWESIMSSVIPDRQVRSAVSMMGSNIMQLGEVIEEFVSSSEGSVLVLRPTFIGRVNETRAHSAGDSLIVWGIPGQKFWPGTIQAVQQSKHTLFILSRREFHNPNRQAFFKRLGPDFTELLESSINDTTHLHFMAENSTERIEVVNKFAARVFLRGRAQDGSPKFALSGQGLQIPDKTHRRLGALFGTRAQPSQNLLGNDPGAQLPSPAPSYGIERPVMFSKHSGRWYITLRQESDVIPLIRHLANEHPKSICVISHSQSAFAYGDIFDPLSRFSVIRSGKKARSVEDALAKFSQWGVPSGLCLLRGIASSTGNESLNFQWATGDALIYWGLPPQESFLWPVSVATTQFTHVYVITPSAQLPTVTGLIGNAFQAHPDSPLVNEQGPGSLLYHSLLSAGTSTRIFF
ncbi:unnamed protein product [Rhizoctonia solani]|uniref:Uncharacterized protein n=1 Tax=Rhizoctonia solani TaxID=456999 RepID=A0A8H3CX03_9AGAM|nr:unnamed protein product [Rhizoctonia solani]